MVHCLAPARFGREMNAGLELGGHGSRTKSWERFHQRSSHPTILPLFTMWIKSSLDSLPSQAFVHYAHQLRD